MNALQQSLLLLVVPAALTGGCRQPAYGPATQVTSPTKARSWDFAGTAVGKLPPGWESVRGTWQIAAEAAAPSPPNVLGQVSREHSGSHFNVAVTEQPTAKDVTVTLKYRAAGGQEDQGGGPVWRYQDPQNYYVARENPLEGNYRVYKVVQGRRIQLGSADVKAPAGQWHTLEVTMIGDHIECSLNGRKYLDVKDTTFTTGGGVGLWTKADAQTQFDDVNVRGR